MTHFYHKQRVLLSSVGQKAVRQFFTMVGMTDHVPDHVLAEATDRLESEMSSVLSKFKDPAQYIECVLAYHFLERQAPIVPSEKDRSDIDKMYEIFVRLYEEDWLTGQYREALRISNEEFEAMRKEDRTASCDVYQLRIGP